MGEDNNMLLGRVIQGEMTQIVQVHQIQTQMTTQIGTHGNLMMVMGEVVIEGVMVWVLFKEEEKKDRTPY